MRIIPLLILLALMPSAQAIVDTEPVPTKTLTLTDAIKAFSDVVIDYTMDGYDVVVTPRPTEITPFAGDTMAFKLFGSKETKSCQNNFDEMTYTCNLKKAYIKYGKSKLDPEKTIYSEEIRTAMGEYGQMLDSVVNLAIELITLEWEPDDSFQFDRIGLLRWNSKRNVLEIECPFTIPEEQQSKKCREKDEYDLKVLFEDWDNLDITVEVIDEVGTPPTTTEIEPIDEVGTPPTFNRGEEDFIPGIFNQPTNPFDETKPIGRYND